MYIYNIGITENFEIFHAKFRHFLTRQKRDNSNLSTELESFAVGTGFFRDICFSNVSHLQSLFFCEKYKTVC